ncbi:MAG: sigma-54 dependent transcriptional regulator [Pseudomonadota bacterium]
MNENTEVVIVDSDTARAELVSTSLDFIDYRPVLPDTPRAKALLRHGPDSLLAVIVGQLGDDGSSSEFLQDLLAAFPKVPLLGLDGCKALPFDGTNGREVWPLKTPLKYPELSRLLRRAATDNASRGVDRRRAPTGNSANICEVRRKIEQVADFDSNVLILGESGTGKELVAQAIHDLSSRRRKPFVAINCGAIPAELMESELFGHEKGAFTGAISAAKGRFEMAEGGTLFLDEIGDMSVAMQVKLLRVLQERTYERVGSSVVRKCDVRIVAATHRKLHEQIKDGTFREDLFYRLNVFPIRMPPLRKRRGDVPSLIRDLTMTNSREGKGTVRLTAAALEALQHYDWPGNVRELANLVERLAILHPSGEVDVDDLPAKYRAARAPREATDADNIVTRGLALAEASRLPEEGLNLKAHMKQLEKELIEQALACCNGTVAEASRLLNVRRTTLVEKLRKFRVNERSAATIC